MKVNADIKLVTLKLVIWVIAILMMVTLGSLGAAISCAFFVVLFLCWQRMTALDLVFLFVVAGVFQYEDKNQLWSFARYVLPVLVIAKAITFQPSQLLGFFFRQWYLFAFLFAVSVYVSPFPITTLINIGVFAALLGFAFGAALDIRNGRSFIKNLHIFYGAFLLVSAISLLDPSISYARNLVSFQGVLNNPNAFGIVIAPYVTLAFFSVIYKPKPMVCIAFAISAWLLLLSHSRTALLSCVLAIIILMITNPNARKIGVNKAVILIMLGALSTAYLVLNNTNPLISYLDKNSSGSVFQSIESSRGFMVEKQLNNIKDNVWLGIGFKVPSETIGVEAEVAVSSVQPYEKGNLFLASMEELGFFGTVVFFFFLIKLFSPLKIIKTKNFALCGVALTSFFTNLGEFTLFSIGGVGAVCWTMIFYWMLLKRLENGG